MLKRTLCLLLCIATTLCFPTFTVSADTSYTQDVSSVNGTRYTDYLVVYTSAYGSNTKTNIYGYEVTVENGTVTSVGGNSSDIPVGNNSFVVSGHGTMRDWLVETVIPGMKVTFNKTAKTITFTKDSSTMLYALNVAAEKARTARQYAIDACLIYDSSADAKLAAAEEKLKTADKLSETEKNKLVDEFTNIAYLFREREVAEYRGVWLRPTQKNMSQVRSYVKQCYDAGINMISIETMYGGTVIYNVPKGSLFEQNPIFNGFDVLKAFTEVCHEYGIELHCWMPVFYGCNTSGENYFRSPVAKKPEWRLMTNNGSPIYTYESTGAVFLNPANDEVQDFLAESFTYILETYDIDGFQLDYIRYRDRYDVDDYGYDSITIGKFKKAYPKYANSNITFNMNANYWNDWVDFRVSQVTKFVERMRDIVDSVAPDVVLSADVGVAIEQSYTTIYQDSISWLEDGLLDMIHPMAYGSGYSYFAERYIEAAGEKCAVVPGLGIYMDEFDGDDMAFQADEMNLVGCNGVVYFQTAQYFGKGANKVLSSTLYTEPTLAPALDNVKTLNAVLGRFIDRVELAQGKGLVTKSNADKLISLANGAISNGSKNASSALGTLKEIESELKAVSKTDLKNRLMLDIQNAKFACYRDENPFILGDVNNDGTIDKYDYILVKRAVMKTIELNNVQSLSADVNGKDGVEKYDYIIIKRHVMKTITI